MSKYAKRARSALLITFGLGASVASTGCDEFWDVVIPASDVRAPTMIPAYYHGGKRTIAVGDIHVETEDPYATYFAISSAVDSGGVRTLDSYSKVVVKCRWRDGRTEWVWGTEVHDGHATQDGDVGDTVSNGLWTQNMVRLTSLLRRQRCPTGSYELEVQYRWRSVASDFHGNRNTHGNGRISWVYPPW